MNRDAILNKAHELAKKAELINGKIPKSTLIAVAIDMAEFGYHQAEKELALTWQDIQKVFHLVNSVLDDPWVEGKTKQELFEEALRRFKKETVGEQKPVIVIPKFRIGDTIKHKSGDDTYYTIVDIVNDSYMCNNNHSWSISSQDYFELVELQPKQEWSEEEIEKAAQEWDSKANFSPFYMTMDGDKPTGAKQDITTHKESFKAGVNWILKSLRPQKQWKPTDEMLEALYRVIPENVKEVSEDEVLLDKLYQGLKYGRILSK